MQGQPLVVDWARGTGEVEDNVHGLLEKKRLGEVVVNEPKIRAVPDVLNVPRGSCRRTVDTDHLLADWQAGSHIDAGRNPAPPVTTAVPIAATPNSSPGRRRSPRAYREAPRISSESSVDFYTGGEPGLGADRSWLQLGAVPVDCRAQPLAERRSGLPAEEAGGPHDIGGPDDLEGTGALRSRARLRRRPFRRFVRRVP